MSQSAVRARPRAAYGPPLTWHCVQGATCQSNMDKTHITLSQGATDRYTFAMNLHLCFKSFVFTSATLMLALPAIAQWQWVDKDGRKVFSDQSPPSDVKDKDILKRPAGRTAPAALVSTEPTPTAAPRASAASAPKLTAKDTELETKKKQAEKEEALQKKAEDDKQAKAKQDNCDRAKLALTTLQSGVRMAITNAAGEREVMDDAKRADETKRVKDAADTNCKK